jgi:iron complex outermembrane recepter protein
MPRRFSVCVLTLALVMVAAPLAAAQGGSAGSFTGLVIDSDTGDPIVMATAALLDGDDLVTGTVSGPDGVFRLDAPAAGTYAIEFSFVGYEPVTMAGVAAPPAGQSEDLGTIRLAPDVAQLDGVEVAAERQRVQIEIDRMVYSTADDPMVQGGTATDILETIPSVDVDLDGNVSLRGSGSVAVLVNGRPAPVTADMIADYLQQLPADAVERIEVIPNPSARFEPDGMAGILNIVLREDADPGLGGSLSARADTRGSVATSNLISFGRGPWSLSATYNLRRGVRERERTSYRIHRLATPLTSTDEISLDDRVMLNQRLGLTAEYALTPRTTISAQTSLRTQGFDEERNLGAVRFDAEQSPIGAWERSVNDDESRLGGDLRLGMRHAFDQEAGHRLSGQARVDFQVRERHEEISERPTDGSFDLFHERQTRLDRTDRRGALDIDYERPIGDFRFETGYSGFVRLQSRDFLSESRDNPSGSFSNDIGLTNSSDYALWIHAVYGQLAREFGPLGMQLGVRLESATTDFEVIGQDEAYRNAYFSAFPSAFLAYEINDDNSLRASYSRRVNRPRTDHQNPFPRFDDPLNVYVGNPAILPEYTHAFELGYVRFTDWGSVTVSPYSRFTSDLIQYVVTVQEDGVTLRTVDNIASSSSHGVEGIVSFQRDALRGHLSLEGFRRISDGAVPGTELERDTFGWGGRANVSYTLDALGLPGTTVQATGWYRAAMRTEQGRTGSRLFTNVAIRQQLLDDRLSLNVRFRDPLGTAGTMFIYDQPALYQEVHSDWGAQRIDFNVSFRFNQPERRRGPERPPEESGYAEEEFEG